MSEALYNFVSIGLRVIDFLRCTPVTVPEQAEAGLSCPACYCEPCPEAAKFLLAPHRRFLRALAESDRGELEYVLLGITEIFSLLRWKWQLDAQQHSVRRRRRAGWIVGDTESQLTQ